MFNDYKVVEYRLGKGLSIEDAVKNPLSEEEKKEVQKEKEFPFVEMEKNGNDFLYDKVEEYFFEGHNLLECSEKFKIKRETVRYNLRKRGVDTSANKK